ncbi:MAG: AI-2E family transporter [Betaproteobacteria bacterium]|nr:AI-2E family transporter [Betaproteobacteria bacterium]
MTDRKASLAEVASWCLAAASLALVLGLHLLPALLAGLLVYELVHVIAQLLPRRVSGSRARVAAVAVIATLVVGVLAAAIIGAAAFLRSDAGNLMALLRKMAEIVESTRGALPEWMVESLPSGADELREALSYWLREHAPELRLAGAEAGRAFAHVLVGLVIGAVIALREAVAASTRRPLAAALIERAARLGESFRRVVFAQVRISALNTVFTALYLAAALPLFGVHLPFTKTLIAITFVAGLLPVIGNLISNTAIVVVSFAASPSVAVASLAYLVVIHKFEYLLNARIVGSQIRARAWELLLVMLVMEAAFGLAGVIAAPIYYAYLKQELVDRGLV